MGGHVKQERFYLVGEEVGREPYLYRASGLQGIYLLNGYQLENHDGEEHVSITDIDGLHKAIGRHIVCHRKALVPAELRFLRDTMELTQSELANLLGNNTQSVARWEKGSTEIPGPAEKLFRLVFLASLMTVDELNVLRDLLLTKLQELTEVDEVAATPAQFELFDRWTEREREPVPAYA